MAVFLFRVGNHSMYVRSAVHSEAVRELNGRGRRRRLAMRVYRFHGSTVIARAAGLVTPCDRELVRSLRKAITRIQAVFSSKGEKVFFFVFIPNRQSKRTFIYKKTPICFHSSRVKKRNPVVKLVKGMGGSNQEEYNKNKENALSPVRP